MAILLPGLLVGPAKEAGILIPDGDLTNFDADKYPHWNVFLNAQLGTPMPNPGSHWENAKIIAKISDDKINLVTAKDLENLGFQAGYSKR